MAAGERAFHEVEINGLKRQLPLFPVGDHLDIAVFNILGDTEVVEAAAAGLADRIPLDDVDALVTAETKSVPLVYKLARQVGKPWVGCGRPTSRTWARQSRRRRIRSRPAPRRRSISTRRTGPSPSEARR